ncbi:hypothetical protein LCGC14_0275890 [marine sediment metagenome]|uniref:Macro domain-containing protein n=1 Tax=marine sediment metagenome TaxID=412755 RepID=A0A0F9UEM3_9ZZZZ
MITYQQGNIFDSQMECLVNPVNTVGVMGKGLALEFKRRYPAMFSSYVRLCNSKQLVVGNPHLWTGPFGFKVLLFPTKKHWRQPSKELYIKGGLRVVAQAVSAGLIDSIAFPAIGCGLGGLDFETQVRPLLDKYLADLPIDVEVYMPKERKR